jgi:hypothetical protein
MASETRVACWADPSPSSIITKLACVLLDHAERDPRERKEPPFVSAQGKEEATWEG